MRILGITHPFSMNTAAVLIEDGKIIAAVEEERFTRIKHAPAVIPHYSIEYVLKEANIKHGDIDKIALGSCGPHAENEIEKFVRIAVSSGSTLEFERKYWKMIFMRERKLMNYLNNHFNKTDIVFVPHHLAHAASACYVSGFNKSLFMTLDGRGEFESGLLGIYDDGEFEIIRRLNIDESLGLMYSSFTSLLGYRAHTDEGKVMGLAPYGRPKKTLEDIVTIETDHRIKIDQNRIISTAIKSDGLDPTKDDRKDTAASAQHLLEKCALSLVDYLTSISGNTKLCLAGGSALNIDMNGAILASGLIKDIFIQPASNDAGTALGAALYVHRQHSSIRSSPMKHAYLGPQYEEDEIKEDIEDSGLKYEELSDTAADIAELISKDKIVAWMQGRAEFGPRALGSRSILANPTNFSMWKKVNMIKNREYWRPLAPSIIEDRADEFFVNHNVKSPFMLLKFQVKEDKKREIPAVVHVDGSARPQTVSSETNPLYWNLIKEFEKIGGVPAVLNTSFNLKGEPIVNNPQDALETFNFSAIDYLCIGKYLIYK
ncbi:MAG: carbamoyltransferase [Nitrosopumilales archaeon]|nr:MAG: carbamoyltransferase [Nitrosopumilales archaeon]